MLCLVMVPSQVKTLFSYGKRIILLSTSIVKCFVNFYYQGFGNSVTKYGPANKTICI